MIDRAFYFDLKMAPPLPMADLVKHMPVSGEGPLGPADQSNSTIIKTGTLLFF